MRICYLAAGPFAHVQPYIDHFKAAGHEVSFVALSPSPPRGVPVYEPGLGHGKWKYPFAMARARAAIRRLKPDVVHAHYATSGGLAAAVCGRRPTIVTAHGTDLAAGARSAVWRPILRAALRRADRVHAVSDELRGLALDLGIDAARLDVLTPGVDTGRFAFAERNRPCRGPLRLICTRRLEEVYDPRTIVEALALARLDGLDFTMTFAGAGPLRRDLEQLAAMLELAPKIRFEGEVAHAELPALLARHDVYLSASRRDGTSLSLLEAMATGVFPVVSDIPANRAWLEHGDGGLLHRPGDPDDLARRLLEAFRRPELAAAAARLNRERVLARGDRGANMQRLEGIYRELAAS